MESCSFLGLAEGWTDWFAIWGGFHVSLRPFLSNYSSGCATDKGTGVCYETGKWRTKNVLKGRFCPDAKLIKRRKWVWPNLRNCFKRDLFASFFFSQNKSEISSDMFVLTPVKLCKFTSSDWTGRTNSRFSDIRSRKLPYQDLCSEENSEFVFSMVYNYKLFQRCWVKRIQTAEIALGCRGSQDALIAQFVEIPGIGQHHQLKWRKTLATSARINLTI